MAEAQLKIIQGQEGRITREENSENSENSEKKKDTKKARRDAFSGEVDSLAKIGSDNRSKKAFSGFESLPIG